MVEKINKSDLEALTEDKFEGQKVTSVNILFLDISSSCTGYAVCNLDFTSKKAEFTKAGALWLDPNVKHQVKYAYMYNAVVNYFNIVEQIDHLVVEQYAINPKKMHGVCVVPEMQGAIKAAAEEVGIKVDSILPQTWRAQLKIKRVKLPNGKFDYKQPTKDVINNLVKVPDYSTSNITGTQRQTPSDLFDALGIGVGWLTKFGISKIELKNVEFNTHIGVISQ